MTPWTARDEEPGYLLLSDEEWLRQAVATLPGFDQLRGVPALEVRAGGRYGHGGAAPFAVTSFDESGRRGLSAVVPLEAVHWPPLVVLARSPLTVGRVEAMRRNGVSAVLNVAEDADRSERLVSALLRAGDWFTADIKRAPLADLLQMWNLERQSGLVWVGCPHVSKLSSRPWAGSATCTKDPTTCEGWACRLWLQAGELVFAESPTHMGVEALSQCLALEEGTVRMHEVYLKPRAHNLRGTMPQLLIGAAALADERRDRALLAPQDRRGGMLGQTRPTQGPPTLDVEFHPEEAAMIAQSVAARSEAIRPMPPPLPQRSPMREPDQATVDALLHVTADVRLAVEMDGAGAVVRSAGDGDAESTAAVATLCQTALVTAGKSLGLGALESWCLIGEQTALYAQHGSGRSCLALASASEHGFRILGQMFEPMES